MNIDLLHDTRKIYWPQTKGDTAFDQRDLNPVSALVSDNSDNMGLVKI